MIAQDVRVGYVLWGQVGDQPTNTATPPTAETTTATMPATTATITTTTTSTASVVASSTATTTITTIPATATSSTTVVPATATSTTTAAVPATATSTTMATATTTTTTATATQPANHRLLVAEEIRIRNQQKLRERMLAIRAGFDKQLLALSLNNNNEQNKMASTACLAAPPPPALARLASTPSAEEEDLIPPKMIPARRSITLNTAEPVSSIKCSICLEPCSIRAKNICPEKCEYSNMCLKCAREYWHSEIRSRRLFIAPLHCPGCSLPVPVKDWRKIAGEEMFATFRQYVSSIFYIRCSGCEQDACFLQYSGESNDKMSKESRLGVLENQLCNQERRNRAAMALVCKGTKKDDPHLARLFTRLLADQLGVVAARRIILRHVPTIDFDSLITPVAEEDAQKVQEQNELVKNALETLNSNLARAEEIQYGRDKILAALDALNGYAKDSPKGFCEAVVDVFGKKAARKLLIRKAVRHEDADQDNEGENADPNGELLLLIEDEERRAQVQHVFMKQFECKVATDCCYTPVCFNCKFYDWHEGLTCEEIIKQTIDDMPVYVDEVVFQCPSCFVQIVHAGGCSSVRCVCGHDFCLEDLGYTNDSSAMTWGWTPQPATVATLPAATTTTTTATAAANAVATATMTTTTATTGTTTAPATVDTQPSVVATNTAPVTHAVDIQPTVVATAAPVTVDTQPPVVATTTAAQEQPAATATANTADTVAWADQPANNISWDE